MQLLLPGNYYHIYNHANGSDLLFRNPDNYEFFINRYIKHVSVVVDTLVYCLMPNHFHLLVKINTESDILSIMENDKVLSNYLRADSEVEKEKIVSLYVSKQFSNLFSSYTQAFNKAHRRMGSLFMKNFKRKSADEEEYRKDLIIYIHQNPVKHGFVYYPSDWNYSSYNVILLKKSTFICTEKVIELFDDVDNFKVCHL